MEVKVKLEKCRKKAAKEVPVPVPVPGPAPVPVHTVYKEQLSDILAKGYDTVTEIPKCDNVKA
jgi:hypothetical protein